MEKIKTIKMFTDSDLDGKGCATLAQLLYRDNINITFSFPTKIDNDIKKFIEEDNEIQFYETVYITDLVISEETANLIDSINKSPEFKVKFYFFDHHETSSFMNKYSWATSITADENGIKQCGTSLYNDYLRKVNDKFRLHFAPTARQFVELVRLWDTWDWNEGMKSDNDKYKKKCQNAKNLNTLSSLFSSKKFVKDMVFKLNKELSIFTKTDEKLLEVFNYKKEREIIRKLNNVNIVKIKHGTAGIVFAGEHISELGNRMCNEMEIDFAIIINPDTRVVSFRSTKEDVHVGKIAEEYGGGGHFHASGFQYDMNINQKFIHDILY